MDDLIKESITLVPQPVFKKAKELYNAQMYVEALEIIRDNAVKFDIYENVRMTVSFSTKRLKLKEENFIPKRRERNIHNRKRREDGKFA